MRGGGCGKSKPYVNETYESTETHPSRESCFINMDHGLTEERSRSHETALQFWVPQLLPWHSSEDPACLPISLDTCCGHNQGGLGLMSWNQISKIKSKIKLTFTWWSIAVSFQIVFSQYCEVFLWVWLYPQAWCFQNKVNNQLSWLSSCWLPFLEVEPFPGLSYFFLFQCKEKARKR